MSRTVTDFESRMKRLTRRHGRMYSNGIVGRMGKDGLISAYPRRRAPKFPLRGFVILFAAAMAYKVVLFVGLGATAYQARVDVLAAGGTVERVGAWMMQADPATRAIADVVSSLTQRL